MTDIDSLYILIHRNYNRLLQVGESDTEGSVLSPKSSQRYNQVRNRQEEIIRQIQIDEHSALFVLPCSIDALHIYPYLPIYERDLIERDLIDIATWARKIGDRFVLLRESFYKEKERSDLLSKFGRRKKDLILDVSFLSTLKFNFSRKVQVYGFGEYTNQCVNTYGRATCRGLKIPERNFYIDNEASIENILMHEIKPEYYHRGSERD